MKFNKIIAFIASAAFWLSNLLTMSILDEGYSRIAVCTLN